MKIEIEIDEAHIKLSRLLAIVNEEGWTSEQLLSKAVDEGLARLALAILKQMNVGK